MIAGGLTTPHIPGMSFFEVEGFILGWRYPSQRIEDGVGDYTEKDQNGFYSIARVENGQLILSRDVLGGKPLYYSLKGDLAFSSFRRYLKEPVEVRSGETLVFSPDGDVIERRRIRFEDVYEKKGYITDEKEIVSRIEEILLKLDPGDSVVSFSGGLDSSLLASLYDIPLVSVTSSDVEEKILESSARSLGLSLHLRKFSKGDVEDVLPPVMGAIETSSPVQVSIAIPIYLSMEYTKEMGYDSAVLGQGADELFGGYRRYVNVLEEGGYEALEKEQMVDLMEIGNRNLVRDSKISYATEIRMILPYLSRDMICLSLRIPPWLRIKREGNIFIRKYILRKVAERHLDREIAFREKRAIQYSTGVMKILRKIAKEEGCNVKEYLELIRNDIG